MKELVNDLLDVSRIQTGKLNFSKEKFKLNELIAETIDGLQGTTNNQPLLYKSKQSFEVFADKFRICQVLTNLITNASKYSPENTAIVIQAKIFERLYQVTDVTEKTFPGLGMGLYISKEIIKRHRGNIWVEGEKGKGSTFYFSLALAK